MYKRKGNNRNNTKQYNKGGINVTTGGYDMIGREREWEGNVNVIKRTVNGKRRWVNTKEERKKHCGVLQFFLF